MKLPFDTVLLKLLERVTNYSRHRIKT